MTQPLTSHTGIVATLNRANVDTDQIIPKQFLKSIERTGFGKSLFFDWRYNEDGSDNKDFELNQPHLKEASILITQNNFGCGSSREHAVWAIDQYGFKVIVAPRKTQGKETIPAFADIFKNNCGKNSIITVELSEDEVNEIFQEVERNPGLRATADLEKQRLVLHHDEEVAFHFDMDPTVKKRIMEGLDDIGISLSHEHAISSFEATHNTQLNQ